MTINRSIVCQLKTLHFFKQKESDCMEQFLKTAEAHRWSMRA